MLSSRADWKYWDAGWAHSVGSVPAGWGEVEHGRGHQRTLLELTTNLREDSVAGEVGTFNKEKALVGAFSGHCETSRRFVDSSSEHRADCRQSRESR